MLLQVVRSSLGTTALPLATAAADPGMMPTAVPSSSSPLQESEGEGVLRWRHDGAQGCCGGGNGDAGNDAAAAATGGGGAGDGDGEIDGAAADGVDCGVDRDGADGGTGGGGGGEAHGAAAGADGGGGSAQPDETRPRQSSPRNGPGAPQDARGREHDGGVVPGPRQEKRPHAAAAETKTEEGQGEGKERREAEEEGEEEEEKREEGDEPVLETADANGDTATPSLPNNAAGAPAAGVGGGWGCTQMLCRPTQGTFFEAHLPWGKRRRVSGNLRWKMGQRARQVDAKIG